jgi:hypothetical protein
MAASISATRHAIQSTVSRKLVRVRGGFTRLLRGAPTALWTPLSFRKVGRRSKLVLGPSSNCSRCGRHPRSAFSKPAGGRRGPISDDGRGRTFRADATAFSARPRQHWPVGSTSLGASAPREVSWFKHNGAVRTRRTATWASADRQMNNGLTNAQCPRCQPSLVTGSAQRLLNLPADAASVRPSRGDRVFEVLLRGPQASTSLYSRKAPALQVPCKQV